MDALREEPIWALPSGPPTKVGTTSLCYRRLVFILVGASSLGGFLEMLPKPLGVVQSPAQLPGASGLFGKRNLSYDNPVVRESYGNDKQGSEQRG
jgi:hypothetical protein